MLFTNHLHYDYPSLLFGETILSFTNTHKHLGVTFQSSGKWDVHGDDMISNTMKVTGVLHQMKFVLSRRCSNTMKFVLSRRCSNTMYISVIRPVLEYTCVVWDSCSAYNANLLEKIQIEAARLVTRLTRSVHLDCLYKEVGGVPLSQRRK